jgi:dihydrodipicolinate synthase/N-acetylneuraminate lyase
MNLVELKSSLKGVIIPVTTPFKENSEVDYDALKKLMEFYLKNNIRCFIAAGSTGQCSTLDKDEHRSIVGTIVNMCSDYDDTFVLAACSHTSTAVSNELADICQEEGANALLLTPPYYRTHGDMCVIHFTDVGKNHDIPLIIYHDQVMPEDISLWDKFVSEPNILGVKFATRNLYLARELIYKYRDRLAIYGGCGMLVYLAMALHGSTGYVAGYANFMPEIENDFMYLVNEGRFEDAARIAELEFELFDNLSGNKDWFNLIVGLINASGLPGGHCRKPLTDWEKSDMPRLKEFITDIKIKHSKIRKQLFK